MANDQPIEPLWRGAARGQRRVGSCKSDRLIAERRQNLLIPQQSRVIMGNHQYRFATSQWTHRLIHLWRRRGRRQAGQPNLETTALARALYVHRSGMVTYDFTYRCQSEAVPGRSCWEEMLGDPSHSHLVHARAVTNHPLAHMPTA